MKLTRKVKVEEPKPVRVPKEKKAPTMKGNVQPFFMKMDRGMMARIDAQCERLGCNRSVFVRMALVRLLEEEE